MEATAIPGVLIDASTVFTLLKAEPAQDGGRRFLYCMASRESRDLENEKVLRKALEESQDYFLAHGNVDIDHLTKIGHGRGVKNPRRLEQDTALCSE